MKAPAYIDIMQKIRKEIISGKLEANQKLDSIKLLSKKYNVNPNTVQKALALLEQEGLLKTKRTAGKYVTDNTLLIKSIKITEAKRLTEEFTEKMNKLKMEENELRMLFFETELVYIRSEEK